MMCYISKYRGVCLFDFMMLEVIKIERWTDILTAREVSINLGMNPKYVYHLWKRDSDMLLEGSVEMKGSTLLITREGYEHLKMLTKKESDLAINWTNSKVNNEVLVPLLNSQWFIIRKVTGHY